MEGSRLITEEYLKEDGFISEYIEDHNDNEFIGSSWVLYEKIYLGDSGRGIGISLEFSTLDIANRNNENRNNYRARYSYYWKEDYDADMMYNNISTVEELKEMERKFNNKTDKNLFWIKAKELHRIEL
jgi:hypothetical protein